MPQYMLLLHESSTDVPDLSPDEIQAIIARYVAWADAMRAKGRLVAGEKLKAGGRVLRRDGARLVTKDGPYAETKECVAGFFLITAEDAAAAEALVRDCPHLDFGGAIELREVDPV